MRSFPIFAVLFFIVPLIEIYLLIQVGSVIGVLPTVLLVVLTAVLGAFLLRQQGLSTLARFQQSVAQGRLPASALLEGFMLLVGGLLLMTPGFFTDAVGLLCLLPPSRRLLAGMLVKRFSIRGAMAGDSGFERGSAHSGPSASSPSSSPRTSVPATLEGEYVRKDES